MASTTVIIPVHSGHGHGSDVPWPWIAGYIAIALIVWLGVAVACVRRQQAQSSQPIDNDDKIEAVLAGMTAAIGWPLTLVGYGIWRIVQRLTAPRIDLTKND